MEILNRKPFQGVYNILRFNWPFFVLALLLILLLLVLSFALATPYGILCLLVSLCILFTVLLSLSVSYYVYDRSNLYQLDWLPDWTLPEHPEMAVIHAGFDETSPLLQKKYPAASWQLLDLYDPLKHREPSIRRARRAYPQSAEARKINTEHIDWGQHRIDVQFLFLAAHEVRNREERILFLKELRKGLKEEGRVVIVEHLRDLPNFLAYTIGFLHFYPQREWKMNFEKAGFRLQELISVTPFIKAFILVKNGTAS